MNVKVEHEIDTCLFYYIARYIGLTFEVEDICKFATVVQSSCMLA